MADQGAMMVMYSVGFCCCISVEFWVSTVAVLSTTLVSCRIHIISRQRC
jgi:hypothetical protein